VRSWHSLVLACCTLFLVWTSVACGDSPELPSPGDGDAVRTTWYVPEPGWSVLRSVASNQTGDVAALVANPLDRIALIDGGAASAITPDDMRPVALGWMPSGVEVIFADSRLNSSGDSLVILGLDGEIKMRLRLGASVRVAMGSEILVAPGGSSVFVLASDRGPFDGRNRVVRVDLHSGRLTWLPTDGRWWAEGIGLLGSGRLVVSEVLTPTPGTIPGSARLRILNLDGEEVEPATPIPVAADSIVPLPNDDLILGGLMLDGSIGIGLWVWRNGDMQVGDERVARSVRWPTLFESNDSLLATEVHGPGTRNSIVEIRLAPVT
jgi:hypothetical protein